MKLRKLYLKPGLMAMLLTACTTQAPDESKTYRYALDGSPRTLDPAQASTVYANFLVTNLYDTLFRYKYLARPYELTPNLAQGMPLVSEDKLSYTIKIKPGVFFIDDPAFPNGQGREITARDFVYSIKRHFDPQSLARGAWLWQGRIQGLDQWKADGSDYGTEVSGLRALDKYTIQIKLSKPYPQLVHTLAQGYSAVVPREAIEHYGREFANHPVGSGPFKLVQFDTAKAVMEKNPVFRQEVFDLNAEGYSNESHGSAGIQDLDGKHLPFVDRVEVQFIQEDGARWNTLISGETDVIRVPALQLDATLAGTRPPELLPELARQYHMLAAMESGLVRIDINMADPEIGYHPDPQRNQRNKALRCAISKAFDWPAYNSTFYYDLAQVFPGIIPPITPEYDPRQDRTAVTRDVEGAKALLETAGWTAENLPELDYGYYASVTQRQAFEHFRSFMMDIGYPLEKINGISYGSFGDYAKAYKSRKVMLILAGWTMDFPDAENVMQLYYGPNETPGSNNANYRNPQFDQLYEQSATLGPSPERTELYRQMNQTLIGDCATISGLSRTIILMWNKRAKVIPDRSFVGGFSLRFADVAQ